MIKYVYNKSDAYIRDIMSGRVPKGSVIRLKWPSGNGESIRFHGPSIIKGEIEACNMSWDNLATETYDIYDAFIIDVIKPESEGE